MLAVYGVFLKQCYSMQLNFFWPVSLAMEAIGDITASAEVSRVEVEGQEFESRIQGGILVSYFVQTLSTNLV